MPLEINQHVQVGTRRFRVLRPLAAPPIGVRFGRTAATPAWIYLGAEPRPARSRGLLYELPFGTFIRLGQPGNGWAEWYELAAIVAAKQDRGRGGKGLKLAG